MSSDSLNHNSANLLARELVQSESPEVIRILTEIATRVNDEEVRQTILNAIRPVANPTCINEICHIWARTRHEALGQVLEQVGWVASVPPQLSLLTALKAGQLEQLKQAGAELLEPLLKACEDADPVVAQNARLVLEQLQNPAARAELFRLIFETDQPLVREIAVAAKYAPADPQQRALFYVLTEQWDQYEALDFDQSLIRAVYQASNEWLQSRIASLTRRAGRAEFVSILAGGRQRRRLTEMTEGEWEVILALLTRRQHWAEMWQLAQVAPAVWSIQLLHQLDEAGWQPGPAGEQAGLAELVRLAKACEAEGLHVGRLTRCQQNLVNHAGSVNDLAISPDGQLLASASDDQTVQLWSLPAGKFLKTLTRHTGEVWSVAISPDSRLLVSGGDDGTIQLWRLPDGQFLSTLSAHTDAIHDLAISPNPLGGQTGQWLLAGGSSDGGVFLWRLPDGKLLATLAGHTDGIVKLAISPEGQLLASGSRDKTIRLWRLPDGTPLQRLNGHTGSVNGLAVSPNGRLLASGSLDQTIRLWRLPEGELFKTLKGHTDAVVDLAIKPGGEPLLASASLDRTIRLWRLSDGALLETLTGHDNWVMSVALSPNGRLLGSGSYNHTIKLWGSDLARLAQLPIPQATLADIAWLQETLQNGKLTLTEQAWFSFILALMRWQRRFDIEVEEAVRQISIGEFDIELEMVG